MNKILKYFFIWLIGYFVLDVITVALIYFEKVSIDQPSPWFAVPMLIALIGWSIKVMFMYRKSKKKTTSSVQIASILPEQHKNDKNILSEQGSEEDVL